jgi:hypothetical protein
MFNSHHFLNLGTKASAAIALWGPHRIGVELFNAVVCNDRSDRSSSTERSMGTFVPLNENKIRNFLSSRAGRAGYRRQGGRDAGQMSVPDIIDRFFSNLNRQNYRIRAAC